MGKQLRADAGGTPWVIQPELVTGCSWKYGSGSGGLCHFCGLNAIRQGPGQYEYMSLEIVEKIAVGMIDFCPNARVEFAMRGEPLIHPKAVEIISMFRKCLPKGSLMLTTNGDTLRGHMQERVEKLFHAGLNLLLLDTYYPKERRDALRAEAFALSNIKVVDFFDEWAGHGMSPYARQHYATNLIVLMDDLAVRDGEHSSRQVKTHAGSNPTKSIPEPLHRNCGRPFRELVVHSNGNVPLCCDDWKQEFVIANVLTSSLQEIWTSPRFEAARARLMQKDRAWGPCAPCDAPMAPRTGLLPRYDPPTAEQIALTESTFIPKEALWKPSHS
jgi:radical SAM protein with 4Fe4S-binding SPASM domain